MKDWPPIADIEEMLTIVPCTLSRRMSLIVSCIRKKGARVLTANILSNNSGLVSMIVPRLVSPAAFTRASTRPKVLSASATTLAQSSTLVRSARTNTTSAPVALAISSAFARPFVWSRPHVTMPFAPRSAKSLAMAAPRPCVPPVTIAIFPCIEVIQVLQRSVHALSVLSETLYRLTRCYLASAGTFRSTSRVIADLDLLAGPGRLDGCLREHERAVAVVERGLGRPAVANGSNKRRDLSLVCLCIALDKEVEVGLCRFSRGRAVKLQLVSLPVVGDDHPLAAKQFNPLVVAKGSSSRVVDMAQFPVSSAHDHHDGVEVAKIRSNGGINKCTSGREDLGRLVVQHETRHVKIVDRHVTEDTARDRSVASRWHPWIARRDNDLLELSDLAGGAGVARRPVPRVEAAIEANLDGYVAALDRLATCSHPIEIKVDRFLAQDRLAGLCRELDQIGMGGSRRRNQNRLGLTDRIFHARGYLAAVRLGDRFGGHCIRIEYRLQARPVRLRKIAGVQDANAATPEQCEFDRHHVLPSTRTFNLFARLIANIQNVNNCSLAQSMRPAPPPRWRGGMGLLRSLTGRRRGLDT